MSATPLILTETERQALDALLDLAGAAWGLADNTCDNRPAEGETPPDDPSPRGLVTIEPRDCDELCAALDNLDQLPDDRPGYTMAAAAKARWALRRLLPLESDE